jgi:hypothetical protein
MTIDKQIPPSKIIRDAQTTITPKSGVRNEERGRMDRRVGHGVIVAEIDSPRRHKEHEVLFETQRREVRKEILLTTKTLRTRSFFETRTPQPPTGAQHSRTQSTLSFLIQRRYKKPVFLKTISVDAVFPVVKSVFRVLSVLWV